MLFVMLCCVKQFHYKSSVNYFQAHRFMFNNKKIVNPKPARYTWPWLGFICRINFWIQHHGQQPYCATGVQHHRQHLLHQQMESTIKKTGKKPLRTYVRAGNGSNTSFLSFSLPLFFISLFQDASWTRPHHFPDLENFILTTGHYIYLVAFIREWLLKHSKTLGGPCRLGRDSSHTTTHALFTFPHTITLVMVGWNRLWLNHTLDTLGCRPNKTRAEVVSRD